VAGSFALLDIDKGWNELLAAAKREVQLKGSYVKAGMVGAKALEVDPEHEEEGKGLTNVGLMAIHEFGVPGRVPERSVIRAVFDKHREEYHRQLRALVGTWYDRRGKVDILRALGLMGLKMVSDMKNYVTEGAGVPPPNAPSTMAAKIRKGSWNRRKGGLGKGEEGPMEAPRALVDSGRMVGAMTHEVSTGKDSEEGSILYTGGGGDAA